MVRCMSRAEAAEAGTPVVAVVGWRSRAGVRVDSPPLPAPLGDEPKSLRDWGNVACGGRDGAGRRGHVCVRVCVRERKRETERELVSVRDRERERGERVRGLTVAGGR